MLTHKLRQISPAITIPFVLAMLLFIGSCGGGGGGSAPFSSPVFTTENPQTTIADDPNLILDIQKDPENTPIQYPSTPKTSKSCLTESWSKYFYGGDVKSTLSLHGEVYTYVYNSYEEINNEIDTRKQSNEQQYQYYPSYYFQTADELLSNMNMVVSDLDSKTIIGFTDWERYTCARTSWINEIDIYEDKIDVEVIRFGNTGGFGEVCWAYDEAGQYIAIDKVNVPVNFTVKDIRTVAEYDKEDNRINNEPRCSYY